MDVDLDGRPVVLYGLNGAGKTNLLEAVSFLTPGRGIRRAKVNDIAYIDTDSSEETQAPAWGVNAYLGGHDPVKLSVGQVPENARRRIIRIDEKTATGAQLASHVKLMWLTPAQDRLFTGPASDRRKFFDRFTLSHTPRHGLTSLRYEKARAERNRLLSDGIDDSGWYDALETDMAAQGAEIAQARAVTIKALRAEISQQTDSAFPKAILDVDGKAETMLMEGADIVDVELYIREDLTQNRHRDRRAGRTLSGVHRTDFIIHYADKNRPASECSTGEQKALLIGLTLAHARAQADHKPFLLLDEVAAHLDEGRRAALIEEIIALGTQVFMTGTDASLFKAFAGRAQIFHVENGCLIAQD